MAIVYLNHCKYCGNGYDSESCKCGYEPTIFDDAIDGILELDNKSTESYNYISYGFLLRELEKNIKYKEVWAVNWNDQASDIEFLSGAWLYDKEEEAVKVAGISSNRKFVRKFTFLREKKNEN